MKTQKPRTLIEENSIAILTTLIAFLTIVLCVLSSKAATFKCQDSADLGSDECVHGFDDPDESKRPDSREVLRLVEQAIARDEVTRGVRMFAGVALESLQNTEAALADMVEKTSVSVTPDGSGHTLETFAISPARLARGMLDDLVLFDSNFCYILDKLLPTLLVKAEELERLGAALPQGLKAAALRSARERVRLAYDVLGVKNKIKTTETRLAQSGEPEEDQALAQELLTFANGGSRMETCSWTTCQSVDSQPTINIRDVILAMSEYQILRTAATVLRGGQ